jgi:hypothetical protein
VSFTVRTRIFDIAFQLMPRQPTRLTRLLAPLLSFAGAAIACHDTTGPVSNTSTPCSASGTLQLSVNQAARVDCSNGGTTLTLTGNGASYLIVPQFVVSLVPNTQVAYSLSSSAAASASIVPDVASVAENRAISTEFATSSEPQPGAWQRRFDGMLRERARSQIAANVWTPSLRRASRSTRALSTSQVPSVGSLRAFRVIANASGNAFSTVGARLAFAGVNVLVYIDTLSPASGFTADQLQAFGVLFDQTLYPIDTAAFGPPTDIDGNGHVIMLMSPAVNALTKASDCQTKGFIAGYFDELDLGGAPTDTNSNHGEVFYSVVPDPAGSVSCAHTVTNLGLTVPATFMHELQHLISFSQHFVVHRGSPEYGWLDEGLSIVAEELGSLFYEQKCPGTSCRTNPAQIFPDSSQGFVQGFLFDSYEYGLRPDTASVTLHSDSDGGFSWRGGDWLLMRWLGDQMPAGFYRKLDQNVTTGVANIESASGQSFPTLFANFGLTLVTDSLPGLPRNTAPPANRFVTRNMRQLWARLFATSAGPQFPLAFPIPIAPISSDTSTHSMVPGTNGYFRLNTPAGTPTVTVQFAAPGGVAVSASLKPQLAVFRLPAGQ